MPAPSSANTMSLWAYSLDGFRWPDNKAFMTPDDSAFLLLSNPTYCSPNTNRAIGKELKSLANVLRVHTNLRIIFEAVVHFAEFWGTEKFWDCLMACLYPRRSFNAVTLESVVTQVCSARKAFHRVHQDTFGRIALLDNAPSVIASLVDKVIHTTAFPLEAPSAEPMHVWATQEVSWPAKLASVLHIIEPGCKAANKSTASLTKKSLAKFNKNGHENKKALDYARFKAIKTGKDAFIEAITSAIDAIARVPLNDQNHDTGCNIKGRNQNTVSDMNARIKQDNEATNLTSSQDENNLCNSSAANAQRHQFLKRKASSPAGDTDMKRRTLESSRNTTYKPSDQSLEIRPTLSKLKSAELIVEDELGNSVARVGTPTNNLVTRGNENTSYLTGEDEVRVVKDAHGDFLQKTTSMDVTGLHSPSINRTGKIYTQNMQQGNRDDIQGIGDSSSAVETTPLNFRSSIRREKSPNMTLLEDGSQNARSSVESQNLSLAQLEARLDSHEVLLSTLREELVMYMSKEDILMPLSQLPERFMQLECNVQRIDNIEVQLQNIQAQMRTGPTLNSGQALPTINTSSKPDVALWASNKHLQYLKKCGPRPFLEGISDEVDKIRLALQAKIKQQDETEQGWKIMGHLGEVLWALDRAVKRAEDGVQEL